MIDRIVIQPSTGQIGYCDDEDDGSDGWIVYRGLMVPEVQAGRSCEVWDNDDCRPAEAIEIADYLSVLTTALREHGVDPWEEGALAGYKTGGDKAGPPASG